MYKPTTHNGAILFETLPKTRVIYFLIFAFVLTSLERKQDTARCNIYLIYTTKFSLKNFPKKKKLYILEQNRNTIICEMCPVHQ